MRPQVFVCIYYTYVQCGWVHAARKGLETRDPTFPFQGLKLSPWFRGIHTFYPCRRKNKIAQSSHFDCVLLSPRQTITSHRATMDVPQATRWHNSLRTCVTYDNIIRFGKDNVIFMCFVCFMMHYGFCSSVLRTCVRLPKRWAVWTRNHRPSTCLQLDYRYFSLKKSRFGWTVGIVVACSSLAR